MTHTCETCTLEYPARLGKCPNGWRPNKEGEIVERGVGKHEAARSHVERHRVAVAGLKPAI